MRALSSDLKSLLEHFRGRLATRRLATRLTEELTKIAKADVPDVVKTDLLGIAQEYLQQLRACDLYHTHFADLEEICLTRISYKVQVHTGYYPDHEKKLVYNSSRTFPFCPY